MKKSNGKSIGIVLVLIVVAVIGGIWAMQSGLVPQSQFNVNNPSPFGGAPAGVYQVYGENFNLQTQAKDSLDTSISYGDDTELDTICWDMRGSEDESDWVEMAGGTLSEAQTGDANIDIDAGVIDANGNVIETGDLEMACEFNLESSQDFFVDQAKIIDVNDEISECLWVDANDDTDETWACIYDLSDITRGNSDPTNEPFDTILVYLFDEDTDGTIMDTSVASVLSVAQSDVTTELLTHLDIASASADVVVITDIRLRNNLTSSTDNVWDEGNTELCFQDSTAEMVWFESRDEVDCLRFGDSSLFDFDQGASTQEYLWSVDDYKDGILVMVPKNEGLQVDIPLKVATKFTGANDGVCVELAFRYMDAFENKASFDAVDIEVGAYSGNTNECAIS